MWSRPLWGQTAALETAPPPVFGKENAVTARWSLAFLPVPGRRCQSFCVRSRAINREEEGTIMSKRTSLGLYGVIALVLLAALAAGCSQGAKAPKMEWTLKVSGAVSKPLELSYADLAKRDQVALENIVMRKSQGEDTTNSWEGPALDPILQEAGISAQATGVTAIAADGYAIQMTMADLNNAIIALKLDGTWIADDKEHGPIRLVAPDKPANHWLFQVTDLVVEETAIASPTPLPTKSPTPAPTATPAPAAGPAALKVGTLGLSLDELKALGVVSIQAAHPKSGEMGTYEGVKLQAVLDKAGIKSGATLTATAGDGFAAEIPYADVAGCGDCLVAIGSDGALQLVMPGMASKTWVKGLASLEVK